MSSFPTTAQTLPAVLERLKRHVIEDMAPEDETAHELLDCLSVAWTAAERWRVESEGLAEDAA
jgi:hypothetical protein